MKRPFSPNPTTLIDNAIKTYPNPADNKLIFEFPVFKETGTLIVYSSQGQELKRVVIVPNERIKVLDIQGFAEGIYYYKVISNTQYSGKFVVQH